MHGVFRRSVASVVAALLLSPQYAAAGAMTARWSTNGVAGPVSHDAIMVSTQTPTQRIVIPEPPRRPPL